MAIHTFGEYPEKFHPHIHAIVTHGLFTETSLFHVMKRVDLKPLEELFRTEVFKFLKKEGKITDDLIQKLMGWRHSGFSLDNGVRIERGDEKGREAIAQCIMRSGGQKAFQGFSPKEGKRQIFPLQHPRQSQKIPGIINQFKKTVINETVM